MAAPSVTARTDPSDTATQRALLNGHKSTFAFSLDPDFPLWEVDVGMPPLDGGELIDITTQHNDVVRTYAPRDLIDTGEFTVRGLYDPVLWDLSGSYMLNRNQAMTRHMPDGTTISFYAVLRRLEADDHSEGTAPMCTATIRLTNFDPVNRVEALPLVVNVAGT